MSDTPRTDRAQQLGHAPASWPDVNEHWVTATFARTLERELAEARDDVERLRGGVQRIAAYHRDNEAEWRKSALTEAGWAWTAGDCASYHKSYAEAAEHLLRTVEGEDIGK